LVIDDLEHRPGNKELMKKLFNGEYTAIDNAKYCNEEYKGGIPCIMLTNEFEQFDYYYSNPIFKN